MRIGFIGLGVMGHPMAGHLQRAGHELFIWARRPDVLVDFPVTRCATPAELGRLCGVYHGDLQRGCRGACLGFRWVG
jgi:2-hydroxy-3-oxopropionate reductase